jgi:hypothetical protein
MLDRLQNACRCCDVAKRLLALCETTANPEVRAQYIWLATHFFIELADRQSAAFNARNPSPT